MLGRAGLRVLLADAPDRNGFNVGEGLPPAAKPLLVELGVWDRLEGDGHLRSYGTESAWGAAMLASISYIRDPHGYGWHLDRARFDARLRDAARERGVALASLTMTDLVRQREGWEVTLTAPGRNQIVRAHWVVDATGRRSRVARANGITRTNNDHLLAFVATFRAPDESAATDVDSLTLVEAMPDGWWYTSRLPSRARVVVYLTDAQDVTARTARGRDGFAQLLRHTTHIRTRLAAHDYRNDHDPLVVAADTSRLEHFAGDGWLAVGDAALSFDPLSSQGLLTAIYSGLRAADALIASVGGQANALDDYRASLATVYSTYLDRKREYYRMERRWPDRPFWRTRQLEAHAAALQ